MRAVSVVFTLLALLAAAGFAVGNRQPVRIGFWPLVEGGEIPLYAALLIAAFVGLIVGAGAVWGAALRVRRTARRHARREVEALRRERDAMQARTADPDRRLAAGPPLPPPSDAA